MAPRDKVWLNGVELGYYQSTTDPEKAQALLDGFRRAGRKALDIHEAVDGVDLHHIYLGEATLDWIPAGAHRLRCPLCGHEIGEEYWDEPCEECGWEAPVGHQRGF